MNNKHIKTSDYVMFLKKDDMIQPVLIDFINFIDLLNAAIYETP